MQIKIEADGSLRLPPEALQTLGAEPGDDVKLFLDNRKKQIRMERTSGDAWADAMRETKSKGLEDIFADQQKREAEADDIFKRKLGEADDD